MKRQQGFTLIEMLVVIGIIGLLLMLTMPALNSAMAVARETACRNNLRNIGTACISYAGDHNDMAASSGHPGSYTSGKPETYCFMGKEVLPAGVSTSGSWPMDRYGTILEYVGGTNAAAKGLYRCPGVKAAPLFSGLGSNGYFDYGMVQAFSGTRMAMRPMRARVAIGSNDEEIECPWIVEEDYFYYQNVNNVEPQHGNNDRIGTWHRGRGNYVATDGSVHMLKARKFSGTRPIFPTLNEYWAMSPSGKEVSVGSSGKPFGWWKDQ